MGMCSLPCEPVSALSPQLGTIFPDAWLKLPPLQLSLWQLVLSPGDMKRVYSFLLRATFYIFGHYVPTILFSRLNNTKSFSFFSQLMIPGPPISLFSEFFPFGTFPFEIIISKGGYVLFVRTPRTCFSSFHTPPPKQMFLCFFINWRKV